MSCEVNLGRSAQPQLLIINWFGRLMYHEWGADDGRRHVLAHAHPFEGAVPHGRRRLQLLVSSSILVMISLLGAAAWFLPRRSEPPTPSLDEPFTHFSRLWS